MYFSLAVSRYRPLHHKLCSGTGSTFLERAAIGMCVFEMESAIDGALSHAC
jgi:hypothetical protein